MIATLTGDQMEAFRRDGFLIVEEGLVSERGLELLRERYLKLFEGEYETGIRPDEVNWVPGRDPEDRTRQLCNAWKADSVVAAQVLSERIGRLAAQLAGYSGVRILQDNVLWKPPGTKAIGFHQDSSYADYLVPSEMITCWISLHETQADAGPIEFVRGSHTWPKSPPARSQFHAPDDWLVGPREAAPAETELDTVPVVVKPGGGSFHHGLTWHGSAPNDSGAVARMALVSHLVPVETRFHETNVDVTYSRYRRRGDLSLDESFFPVVWDETGYRTPWLAELPDLDSPGRKLPTRSSASRMSQGGSSSAARRTSGATRPGSVPSSLAASIASTRPSLIAPSASSRSTPCSRVNESNASSLRRASTSSSRDTPSRHATRSTAVRAMRSIVSPRPSASDSERGWQGSATGVGSKEPPPSATYGSTTAATSASATMSGRRRLTRISDGGTAAVAARRA